MGCMIEAAVAATRRLRLRLGLQLLLLLLPLAPTDAAAAAAGSLPPGSHNMSNVVVGRGGYPRGVQLLSGTWLVCVGMDIYASDEGARGPWQKRATVLRDGRPGVDLANCNLAQLPSGRVLASYRHHVPQHQQRLRQAAVHTASGGGGSSGGRAVAAAMRYAIEVSGSDDDGHHFRALSTVVSGPVGMWEPFLWPPRANERRGGGGATHPAGPPAGDSHHGSSSSSSSSSSSPDVVWAAYSQELTNGGLQSIVWQVPHALVWIRSLASHM
jgi:hypothetical protein